MANVVAELRALGGAVKTTLTSLSAREFLLQHPSCPYTTARTVQRTSLFEMDAHMRRLAESLALVKFHQHSNDLDTTSPLAHTPMGDLRQADHLERALLPVLRESMSRYLQAVPSATALDRELKVAMLVCWTAEVARPISNEVIIKAHVSDLVEHSSTPCIVEVLGHPRENAAAKDSKWVSDRQDLERQQSADANETILQDDEGRLYEGLQSNFYVVTEDDAVMTAPDGLVLRGTVQNVVEAVAQEHSIKVVHDLPRISDSSRWKGAFITSTSRLVLPIRLIRFKTSSTTLELPHSPVIERLRQLVREQVHLRSRKIL